MPVASAAASAASDQLVNSQVEPDWSTANGPKAFGKAVQELLPQFRARGFDPTYYLLEDDASDLPYRDLAYSDRMGTAPEDIGLSIRGKIVGYMSERAISPLIDSIRNEPRKLHRLCFPAEMRTIVERRLKPFIAHERQ